MDPLVRIAGKCLATACVFAALAANTSFAGMGPAAHAPIGVMGDHTHAPGEVMFSYRFMRMGMNGSRDGGERISSSRVLEDFVVTPLNMDMDMHMFGAMFAPVERVTLMLMVPYVSQEMSHKTRTGVKFKTYSEGIGDVRASVMVDLFEDEEIGRIHANLGVSFPTGSISENDRTPLSAPARVRLPYPMQIGSGTYDFLPGLTYRGSREAISWGAQAMGEIRMNQNHAQYRLGNEYLLTGWGAYEISRWVSASLRLEWSHRVNPSGRDRNIATTVGPNPLVPTADTGRRAGMRLDVLAGLNFIIPEGPLAHLRFAIEAGLPAYQYYDGPQLETDFVTTVGVQYAFH